MIFYITFSLQSGKLGADTEYVNKNISTVNKFTDMTDKGYWAFYEIMEAANTHNFVNSASDEIWVK